MGLLYNVTDCYTRLQIERFEPHVIYSRTNTRKHRYFLFSRLACFFAVNFSANICRCTVLLTHYCYMDRIWKEWNNRELYRIVRHCNYRGQQQLPDPAVAMRDCCLRLKLHEGVLARLIISSVYCCSKRTN